MGFFVDKKIRIKTKVLHIVYDSSLIEEIQCELSLTGPKNITTIYCSTESLREIYLVLDKFLKELRIL